MNRSILIVICDFIVLSMMSLFSGYMPGSGPNISSNFVAGHAATASSQTALDQYTTDLILEQLRQKAAELETMRKELEEKLAKAALDKANEEEFNRISEELANIRAKYQYLQNLKSKGTTTVKSGQEMDLTLSELIAQNENEVKKSNLLQMELERIQKQLAESKQDDIKNRTLIEQFKKQLEDQTKLTAQSSNALENVSNTLKNVNSELASKNQQITKLSDDLQESRKGMSAMAEKIAVADVKLNAASEQIAATRAEKIKIHNELTEARREIEKSNEANRNLQTKTSFTQGQLSQTEKELANFKNAQQMALKALNERELELMDTKRKLSNMEKSFTNAVNELSKTQVELKDNKNSVASLNNEVMIRERSIAELNSKLRNDVTILYNNAVMALSVKMVEKQLIRDRQLDETYYLPKVKINDKVYLIDDLLFLFNRVRNSAPPDEVTSLELSIGEIKKDSKPFAISTPIFLYPGNERLAFIEVPTEIGRDKALELITMEEVKKRDLNDFYLYKPGMAGTASTTLAGRVSMTLDTTGTALIIRNSTRTSSELKAEVGDFVLTKQGEFVGVVEQINSYDLGRRNDARVVTFNEIPNIDKFRQVSLKAKSKDGFHQVFQDEMKKVMQKTKK